MKRFWLVMLSLGLIAAFHTQAMAVDVLISGEYYVAGMYLDKTTLKKDAGPSTAFYFQRLRMDGVFVVASGLELFTRMDVMERSWGATRTAPGQGLQGYTANVASAGTTAENENIAFDLAYVSYASPIGKFLAGYQIDGAWGTVFGDNSIPTGKVSYYNTSIPGLMFVAQMGKNSATNTMAAFNTVSGVGPGGEQSAPRGSTILGNNSNDASDRDSNFYTAALVYAYKGGSAGFLYKYVRNASTRGLVNGAVNIHVLAPYAKVQLGPVAIQTELMHVFGQYRYEAAGKDDKRLEVLNAWVDATADFGMFYAGGTAAYLSGQDPNCDALKQGIIDGGYDWNPTLILFNADRTQWAGNLPGHAQNLNAAYALYGNADNTMANAYFFQVRGGVRPVDKLDIGVSLSYANAVVKPTNAWLYNDYGWEVDLTATYSITSNLSYMLGGGYLFTGKYFKAASDTNEITNDYMIINKLTLTF